MSYSAVPDIDDPSYLNRGYGGTSQHGLGIQDFSDASGGVHSERRGRFEENFDARTRGSSVLDGDLPQRSSSRASTLNQGSAPSRSGTLKKKGSVKRTGSLKRSGSRRSLHAGSIRGVAIDDQEQGYEREQSIFYTPVPTKGSPTDILAERFQTWRKFLKDLIIYFREVASSYEHRAKSLLKVSNVINNTNAPAALLIEGGLNDANRILRDFHKQTITEANKARDIEADVINQLSGLRADLAQKIKEIKSLSGDFKNSVEKEKETTRKCVAALEEALALVDSDPAAAAGKGDPYVVGLGVERQVEKQIDEENYLHRAYLNLENSGRELESIVVGEIQKAYNALASILKRDADEMYNTVENLRSGPITMPRDHEWGRFVRSDPHFVNPDIPLRRLEDIEYPGKHHPATTEVRAGMLERKSKYLKSYTPGWYVLSPTHIHEFKSADRIYSQPPVMSLCLLDQKLGSKSQPGSSSHKFVIKGRQTGTMHRGHTWVFRAETYETMQAWYDDIKTLTEKTGEERNAFVRRHASVRSTSAASARSASSDGGLEEDEADAIPYSAAPSVTNHARDQSSQRPPRPSPGGRFPSDLNVDRNLQVPLSPSSGSSEVGDDIIAGTGDKHEGVHSTYTPHPAAYPPTRFDSHGQYSEQQELHVGSYPSMQQSFDASHAPVAQNRQEMHSLHQPPGLDSASIGRHDSSYGSWMAPAVVGAVSGTATGTTATKSSYQQEIKQQKQDGKQTVEQKSIPQEELEHYPVGGATALNVAPTISERNPEHIAPESLPAPVVQANAPLPVSVPIPSETVRGGSKPVQLSETADVVAQPRVARQNTDVSASELHVPGEYPKGVRGRVSESVVPQPL